MRRIAVLIILVMATAAVMTFYAPNRAQASCTNDLKPGEPCCDLIVNDHWADPACEPKHSLLSSARGIGAIVVIVAGVGLLFVFAWRARGATGPRPEVSP